METKSKIITDFFDVKMFSLDYVQLKQGDHVEEYPFFRHQNGSILTADEFYKLVKSIHQFYEIPGIDQAIKEKNERIKESNRRNR